MVEEDVKLNVFRVAEDDCKRRSRSAANQTERQIGFP
jgi:hypothetical protein